VCVCVCEKERERESGRKKFLGKNVEREIEIEIDR
jgi:hypothetical protein